MKVFIAVVLLFTSVAAGAEDVFRIEIGKKHEKYSNADLQRRVWELERAVWQLQRQVFQLAANGHSPPPTPETWVCTIEARGNIFTGTGASKALAKVKSIENCKGGNGGNAFFCDDPKCEQ